MWTTVVNDKKVRFRGMMHDDLREVLTIEADAFVHPWSESDFANHLEDFSSVALVAECADGIIGYLVFEFNDKEIRICSCVVAKPYRCQGIGRLMLQRLTEALATQRWNWLTAKVPETNLGGLLFFKQCGFKAVSVLSEYLLNGQDVYVMQYATSNTCEACFQYALELVPFWAVKHD